MVDLLVNLSSKAGQAPLLQRYCIQSAQTSSLCLGFYKVAFVKAVVKLGFSNFIIFSLSNKELA